MAVGIGLQVWACLRWSSAVREILLHGYCNESHTAAMRERDRLRMAMHGIAVHKQVHSFPPQTAVARAGAEADGLNGSIELPSVDALPQPVSGAIQAHDPNWVSKQQTSPNSSHAPAPPSGSTAAETPSETPSGMHNATSVAAVSATLPSRRLVPSEGCALHASAGSQLGSHGEVQGIMVPSYEDDDRANRGDDPDEEEEQDHDHGDKGGFWAAWQDCATSLHARSGECSSWFSCCLSGAYRGVGTACYGCCWWMCCCYCCCRIMTRPTDDDYVSW